MNVNGLIAFVAGVLSFFSPCVLPLIPSYLIYISGASITNFSDLSAGKLRKTLLKHSVAFIAGFSLVFMSLGISSSLLGNVFSSYESWIVRIGGLLLILMGLNSLNVLKIPILNQEKMVHLKTKPIGLVGSFAIGITFSLGWTPCIGPVLSTILIIASTSNAVMTGVYLLGLYSLGLAIPFFAAALLCDRMLYFLQRYGHMTRYSSIIIGVLLIAIGVLLITGYYTALTNSLMGLWG